MLRPISTWSMLLFILLLRLPSAIAHVSFNPCAHQPAFIDVYSECIFSEMPEEVASKGRKKLHSVPGLTSQEVFILICRANNGQGEMLFGEFLKEIPEKHRQKFISEGERCHKLYEHM